MRRAHSPVIQSFPFIGCTRAVRLGEAKVGDLKDAFFITNKFAGLMSR